MRVCSGPGCLRAVPDKVRFCDECDPEQTHGEGIREHTPANRDRERYKKQYESPRFRRIRDRILQRHPLCEMCNSAASEICDHRIPAGEAVRQARESGRYPFDPMAGFFLLSNLQALCRSCHAIKTNRDKAHQGPWPDVLAIEDAAPKKKWSW